MRLIKRSETAKGANKQFTNNLMHTIMNTYEQQANDFLKATNTTFKAEFIKNDYHFQGDESTRDIYKCTFKRGNRQFSVKFGQSLQNSQKYIQQMTDNSERIFSLSGYGLKGGFNIADITKYIDGFSFTQKPKLTKGTPPTAYDVLTCLEKYEYQDFEDFCSAYGYDLDSRKAEKIYKACVKEFAKVCKLWNDEEIELLQEIQ